MKLFEALSCSICEIKLYKAQHQEVIFWVATWEHLIDISSD